MDHISSWNPEETYADRPDPANLKDNAFLEQLPRMSQTLPKLIKSTVDLPLLSFMFSIPEPMSCLQEL